MVARHWDAIGVVMLVLLTACHGTSHPQATGPTKPPTKITATPSVPTPALPSSIPAPTAPTCRVSQLGLAYRGGGFGGGLDFGRILIRDTSASPCTLVGTVGITPVDGSGRPIPLSSGPLVASLAGTLLLTPNAVPPPGGQPVPPGTVEAEVALTGDERDDPVASTGATCAPANEVQPAAWRLSMLDGSLIVANRDASAPSDAPSLYACRGGFGPPKVEQAT